MADRGQRSLCRGAESNGRAMARPPGRRSTSGAPGRLRRNARLEMAKRWSGWWPRSKPNQREIDRLMSICAGRSALGRGDAVTAPHSAPQDRLRRDLGATEMTIELNRSAAVVAWRRSALGALRRRFRFPPRRPNGCAALAERRSPARSNRDLEAQGYVLTAPLMRRPGVYLADVSAGPGGHQRLIIDARSGQVLERFPAPGRNWGPALAARDEEFGEPQPGGFGPPLGPGFAGQPAVDATAGSAYGGPANVHIPAAVSPYSAGETRAGSQGQAEVRVEGTQGDHQPAPAAPRSTRIGESGRIRLDGARADRAP